MFKIDRVKKESKNTRWDIFINSESTNNYKTIRGFAFKFGILLQPSGFKHRLNFWVATAPIFVHFFEIQSISSGKNHISETLTVLTSQASVSLEPIVGIVMEHLCPRIRIITRSISSSKNM